MNRARLFVFLVGVLASSSAWCAPDGAFGLGTGKNGAYPGGSNPTPAPSTFINIYTTLASNTAVSAVIVNLTDATGFNGPSTAGGGDGDLVMLWQPGGLSPIPESGTTVPVATIAANMTSSGVGRRELARITARSGNQLTVTSAECKVSPCALVGLLNAYTAGKTQVVRIPEYTTVSVGAGVNFVAVPWFGVANTGGIVAFLANGAVTVTGSINADGAGFEGGPAQIVNPAPAPEGCIDGDQPSPDGARRGEGLAGFADDDGDITGLDQHVNGGGGGVCKQTGGGGGGNGGTGGLGGQGPNSGSASRGRGARAVPYDDATNPMSMTSRMTLGGGGGAGHLAASGGASAGRAGGGIVFVRALSIGGSGSIRANASVAGATAGGDGQGGGGGGGSIYLRTAGAVALCDGDVEARGSDGIDAQVASGAGAGGGGGGGRSLIQSTTLDCQTASATKVDVGAAASGANDTGSTAGSLGSIETSTPLTTPYCSTDGISTPACGPGSMCDMQTNACVPAVPALSTSLLMILGLALAAVFALSGRRSAR